MKILFWGTPEFALPSLGALLGEGHEVVGVVTQPDRPSGRGQTLAPPPVKQLAEEEMLPLFQPEKARDPGFLEQIRAMEPDLNVVVAYGQILSQEVLDAPANGSINVHASLLPELRGAAPINWAIARGHRKTGITIMRMVRELDAGPILMQVEEPILDGENASDLMVRLSELGAATLVEALAIMEFGDGLAEREQDHDAATYAPRITRDDAHVDWSRSARDVVNLIRGMDAVPGAWTRHNGQDLKVYRPALADPASGAGATPAAGAGPGVVLDVHPGHPAEGLLVQCGEGAVWIREVQPAGKRRMTAADWLRGRGAQPGDRLE